MLTYEQYQQSAAYIRQASGGFEPDAARGCECCLHDGKIGRAKEQHDDNRQKIP